MYCQVRDGDEMTYVGLRRERVVQHTWEQEGDIYAVGTLKEKQQESSNIEMF